MSVSRRTTDRPDRARAQGEQADLIGFAHERIDHWMARSDGGNGNDYLAAVALLRAVYDMVDRLKSWEEARDQDGRAVFRRVCAELDAEHGAHGPRRSSSWRRFGAALLAAPNAGWTVGRLSPPAFRRQPE